MKISEIRLMSTEELRNKLQDNQQEYMNLRFQIATGQQTDTSRLRVIRHTVAQFETIVRERELEINQDLEKLSTSKHAGKGPKPAKKQSKAEKPVKEEEPKETKEKKPAAAAKKPAKAAVTKKTETKKPAKTTKKQAKEGDK